MGTERRGLLATAAATLLVVGVVLRRALAGEALFRRDVHLMWYTQVEAAVAAVARGEWPLWNDAVGFGQPLWADANVQIAYPPTWLNLVLRPWTCSVVFAVLHVLLAALGARALARVLGLGEMAAGAAGVLWASSGPVLSMVEVWNQLAGAAWLPWALAAAVRALRGEGRRWIGAGAAAAAAQVMAGSPEAYLLTWLGVGAYALVARPWHRAAMGGRRAVGTLAGVLLLSLALSGAQWVPSAAAAAESNRVHLSADARGYWSVHPLGAWQLLLPGGADEIPLRPELREILFGGRSPLLPSLYLGLTTVLLAMAAFVGPRPRAARWLALAAGVTVVLAFGRHVPLLPLVAEAVPPLGTLRYPVKMTMATSLCWSLLCGLGLEAWRSAGPSRFAGRWALLVVAPAALLVSVATAASVAMGAWPEVAARALLTTDTVLPAAARLAPGRVELAAVAAVAALAVALAAWRARAPPRAAGAVLALAVIDLLAVHHDLVPTAPVALYTHRPETLDLARPPGAGRLFSYDYNVPGTSMAHLGRPDPFRVERGPAGWTLPATVALAMRLSLFPPSAAPWGVAGSFDHDTPVIAPRRAGVLVEARPQLEGTDAHDRLLRLAGVSRVVARHRRGFERLELLGTADALLPEPVLVSAVPGARPRAFAVGGARVVPGDAETLAVLLDPAFDPSREVVLAGGPALEPPSAFQGRVDVVRIGADRVWLRALVSSPGLVVLNDAWARGWTARVDGREAAVERANLAFRAVRVEAGAHEIEMRYRAPGLTAGLGLSLLGAAIAAALLRGGTPGAGTEAPS